jgi:hypothetical protein
LYYFFKRAILNSIDLSINFRNGSSKLFNKFDLENFKILSADDLFLFFLPNYFMSTPLQFMLSENYFDLFDGFFEDIVQHFPDFITNDNLISKIANMFIFIFQYVYNFTKTSIAGYYCCLGYDVGYFEDCDDVEDDVDKEAEVFKKVKIMNTYLEEIEKN